ncbi:MAG: epoxyqueuosine reductase [Deltaproteobacteria bacterium]|nr:epoxyqueuosine reductase [Candidatus Zymogenaceae bacterium]
MITAARIKKLAAQAGADLCGIAPVSRFSGAPHGFRPTDIWADARSVVVVAKRVPEGALLAPGPVPYKFAYDTTLQAVYLLMRDLALALQDSGVTAVPVPSEPYEYWDEQKREGRGILSLKHAGVLAGLGVMGTNTLLTNDRFGNRITLGALLAGIDLAGDGAAAYTLGCETCNVCVASCPAGAIGEAGVDQKLCRDNSSTVTPKGYSLETCRACRTVCPKGRGLSSKSPGPKR